ncbi:MAG: YifB family Mg chelatase-like AAA ATPase [Pseudomonadota bacterium]
MVSSVRSVAFLGVEARLVTVECALSPGLPAFHLVGLPDKAISESKERVRAALTAVGLALPPQRITVNLSPADLPKTGSHFDLPIALALMASLGVLPDDEARAYVAMGELGLDGSLRPVQGALPAALAAAEAGLGLICPAECGAEAAWVGACEVLAPAGLLDFMNHVAGRTPLSAPEPGAVSRRSCTADLIDVKGQESARRALEVAAAGGHHILMVGEPGAGKSMLARRITSILPPLTPREALEVATIRSLAGEAGGAADMTRERPFRAPHHTASKAALTGGGPQARPGEISLAHCGVLFLDELPEFDRAVLESLRQPMETGEITVSRASAHLTYPARFLLAAAMNPCRCGYLSDPGRACSKAPRCGADYSARLSGPLLDRFDIRIHMPPVTPDVLALAPHGDGSARVSRRVGQARDMQSERANGAGPIWNAALEGEALDRCATPDQPGREILQVAAERQRLSARGYHRILRVARTVADLDGATGVGKSHVAEAISYRRLYA